MGEGLKTISTADFKKFVEVADSRTSFGQSLWKSCLLRSTPECPDQNMPTAFCARCPVAKSDETSMAEELRGQGFEIITEPQPLWYSPDKKLIAVAKKDAVRLDIAHSDRKVTLSFHRIPDEQTPPVASASGLV